MNVLESPHWDKIMAFGKTLIQTEDLDPVYVAVVKTTMPMLVRKRLLLAYWCFYHLGVSAWLAERSTEEQYWLWMNLAAANPDGKWPRGTERRHFRGDLATTYMNELSELTVNERFETWFTGSLEFSSVAERVQKSRGFGPWIAFKVADMVECIMGIPVDFSECDMGVYSDPAAAASLLLYGDKKAKLGPGELKRTMVCLEVGLKDVLDGPFEASAPPNYARDINAQEVETVMCKYKSHVGGHYPVGKDTREIREALKGWGTLASRFLESMPESAS